MGTPTEDEATEYLRHLDDSRFEEALQISGVDRSHINTKVEPYMRARALVLAVEAGATSTNRLYDWISQQTKYRKPGARPTVPQPASQSAATRAASRAPIVVALQLAGAELAERELLRIERHLTITLSADDVDALVELSAEIEHAQSQRDLLSLGLKAWYTLDAAQPELAGLLDKVVQAQAQDGHPQPIGWTGRVELLASIHRAILLANTDASVGSMLSVRHGAHYFHPLSSTGTPNGMQRREARSGASTVRIARVSCGESADDAAMQGLARAVSSEVVVLSGEQLVHPMRHLVEMIRRQAHSPTRVVVGVGRTELTGALVEAMLAVLPCISFAGPALLNTDVVEQVERVGRRCLIEQAVPVVLSAVRRGLLESFEAGYVGTFRAAACWSTWSWVGRPLFSNRFGEVLKPAYPHLMDLRSVASREWYFPRSEDIPTPYKAENLATRANGNTDQHFHLYVTGAGGTGKSCFLRYVYETLNVNHPNEVLPVWYKVDAPSSEWRDVESRIKQEIQKALAESPGQFHGLVDEKQDLGVVLKTLIDKLRTMGSGITEIVLFIDQLERTFESGDSPEIGRLEKISEAFVRLLEQVGVGAGVRVFIASRKQYLPDFLGSFQTANERHLHFNVLQTIRGDIEKVEFIRSVLRFCKDNKLVSKLDLDSEAKMELASSVNGHPLNMMLAVIQLFSEGLSGTLSKSSITSLALPEKLFYVDEELAAKDDLDWYLFLAMAHARTEIVRFEEVWWRLRLVSSQLTQRANYLGRKGVLERLWLLGHLGRTIHPRPMGDDEAGFLEFFHANLRDHLLRNVMNYASNDRAPGRRRGGMPAAWRALDRLAEVARDWQQSQQLLLREDVAILMEHREVFVGRIPKEGGETEVEAFYLLFTRDARDSRPALLESAKQCFVYSAVVHDILGRWAFAQMFPSVEDRVACCRRWLLHADRESKFRLLQYLVELRAPQADKLLIKLVFDAEAANDEPWQHLASILADPLVAGTRRGVFLTQLAQHLLEERIELDRDNWHARRFGAFVAATCGGDPDELGKALRDLSEAVATLRDPRLEAAVTELVGNTSAHQRWLLPWSAGTMDTATSPRDVHGIVPPQVELRVGAALREIFATRLASWRSALVNRLGLPLPEFSLSDGEIARYRSPAHQHEEHAPPEGFEVQLLIRGHLIALGDFYPDRVQTLSRDWNRTQILPSDVRGYDEGLREPVRWLRAEELERLAWSHRAWPFEAALLQWMERLMRRNIAAVFTYEDIVPFLREVAAEGQGRVRVAELLRSVADLLYPTWTVIAQLAQEFVPLATTRAELIVRLHELLRQTENVDRAFLNQKLREQVSADLCRALADDANELSVMLIDPDEEAKLQKALKVERGRYIFTLHPDQAFRLVAAVQAHYENVARSQHRSPVLVCEDHLRLPLYGLLQHFDPRIQVLSYTELAPQVRLSSAGIIPDFVVDAPSTHAQSAPPSSDVRAN